MIILQLIKRTVDGRLQQVATFHVELEDAAGRREGALNNEPGRLVLFREMANRPCILV